MRGCARRPTILVLSFVVLLVAGRLLPDWGLFLVTVALAKGLVVLGLLLLMRAGLVSFGQGLYFGLGAYAVGIFGQQNRGADGLLMLLLAVLVASGVAGILGLLLAGYRGIFFAMLSLAFSMVLYGALVKSSTLGSTDGFNIVLRSVAALSPDRYGRYLFFALSLTGAFGAALGVNRFIHSGIGRLAAAVRDNELRVEYLGASVRAVVYLNILIAAALAGLGGGLTSLVVGHVDPDMVYWTSSGEVVFVAILSGTGSVMAPFLGSLVFEVLRSFAYQYSPNTWQLVVGVAMLVVIALLPAGLWSLFAVRRRAA